MIPGYDRPSVNRQVIGSSPIAGASYMASDLRVLLIRDCLRDLGVSDFQVRHPSRPSPQVKRYLPAAADGSPTVSRTLPPGCPTVLRDGDLGPWPAARTGKNDVGWEETGTGPGLRPDVARQREDGRGRPRSRRVGRIGARACAPHCEASSLARQGAGRHSAPLVVFDAGYSAAALTAALASCPVHLLIRLPSGSVFYANPVAWPGEKAAWQARPAGYLPQQPRPGQP